MPLFPFDDCPHKTDELICQAAGKFFAKKHTTYGLKLDYQPYESGKHKHYLPDDVKHHYDVHADAHHHVRTYAIDVEATHTYSKSLVHKVKNPLIIHGKWYSDTFADLVIINNNCCFNAYPDVYPGDKLSVKCDNPLIGDPVELYKNFRYSVLSPGAIDAECSTTPTGTTCAFPYSVVALNNWVSATGYQVAVTDITDGAPATEDIAIYLQAVPEPGDEITVAASGLITAGGDPNGRLDPAAGTVAEEELLMTRDVISAQVCALSGIYSSLEPNGRADLDTTSGDLFFDCTERHEDPCVIEVIAEEVALATVITIDSGSSNQVIINVIGKDSLHFMAAPVLSNLDTPIVWNTKALSVLIDPATAPNDWTGNIIAPSASLLEIFANVASVDGSFLLGNPASTFRISGSQTFFEMPSRPLQVDIPEPTITLCTCLCESEDCDPEYRRH